MSALEEVLASGYDVDIDVEEHRGEGDSERFRITDEGAAEWALRKMAVARRRAAANSELANAEITRIEGWLSDENGKLEREASFFESLLIEYHRTCLAEDPKRKQIALPAGVLKSRKNPDGIEIDEDQFIPFAKQEREDLLRVTVAPDKKAVKEAALKDGEVLPGVTKVDGSTTFKVEVTL